MRVKIMIILKDLLEVADANLFCKLIDIAGKVLVNNKSVYEIAELYDQYSNLHVINCSIVDNCFYIILDINKRI